MRVRRLGEQTDAVLAFLLGVAHAAAAADVRRYSPLLGQVERAIESGLARLVPECEQCVDAIVRAVGCRRSRDTPQLVAAKCERLVDAVLAATAEHERRLRAQLADTLALVDQCGEAVRSRIFAELGGRVAVQQRGEDAIGALRPWTAEWLAVQRDAFSLREVFGNTDSDLDNALQQSVDQAVRGYCEVLEQNVVGVLMPLVEDMQQMRELVDAERKAALSPRRKK